VLTVAGIAIAALVALTATFLHGRTTGRLRRRIQLVLAAAATYAAAEAVAAASWLLFEQPRAFGATTLALTAFIPVGVALGYSARLRASADRILTATLEAAGSAAPALTAGVIVIGGFRGRPNPHERVALVLGAAATIVALGVAAYARPLVRTGVARAVRGRRLTPAALADWFAARLTRALPLEELLLQLTEAMQRSFDLASAEVWTAEGPVVERVASIPHMARMRLELDERTMAVLSTARVAGNAWAHLWLPGVHDGSHDGPLRIASAVHSGELVAILVAARPTGGERFTDEDDAALGELARQVAAALRTVRLDAALQDSLEDLQRRAEELRSSRARIVAAGDAERRRIERDLHDGAQQRLVAVSIELGLARAALERDPDEAVAILDRLQGEVRDTVADVRALAHGVYPPALRDGGLSDALRAAAARAALPTDVDARDIGRYPEVIEAAVYFCCLEALQNAAKHAGPGAEALITVLADGDVLHFEVRDNGAGFADDRGPAGQGLQNMIDRVGALGGSLDVTSAPGQGTVVAGVVPVVENA
jgi:signal transduction histidine kinase